MNPLYAAVYMRGSKQAIWPTKEGKNTNCPRQVESSPPYVVIHLCEPIRELLKSEIVSIDVNSSLNRQGVLSSNTYIRMYKATYVHTYHVHANIVRAQAHV